MLGPFFLVAYALLSALSFILPARTGDRLKARWALTFSALSDGGLDDDFAERLFLIVRARPALLPELVGAIRGQGFVAMRQRGTLQMVGAVLQEGRNSIFG